MLNNSRTTREQDNFRIPCDPPRRPQRKWIAPALSPLILAAGLAMNPPTARAQITYTWTEDDTQNVTGSLVVSNAALGTGQINTSNIASFNFALTINGSGHAFTQGGINPNDTSIFISTQNAYPISGGSWIAWQDPPWPAVGTQGQLHVILDTSWSLKGGESWFTNGPTLGLNTGIGHWTISEAAVAVPEPSCAVEALIVAVSGLTYGLCRHRWKLRRKPAGQTDATQ